MTKNITAKNVAVKNLAKNVTKNSQDAQRQDTQRQDAQRQDTRLAVVLIRGVVKAPPFVRKTLALLNLHRVNQAVISVDTPALRGMVKQVKDYVTWGEISVETLSELLMKRGELYQGRLQDRFRIYKYRTSNFDGKAYKPSFRLSPPRSGFGRKGVKVAYAASGGLGYRGEAINDLIRRML